METMYYIGLDVHKRTISYCVKDVSGRVYAEGSLPATRFDLDRWMKTLPQPWTAAMEATVFTGWNTSEPADALSWSYARAQLVWNYLEARYPFDAKKVGLMPLSETPPPPLGHDHWSGVSILVAEKK